MKNAKEFKLIECSGTPYEIGWQWGEGNEIPFEGKGTRTCINKSHFYELYKKWRESGNKLEIGPALRERRRAY